MFSKLPFQTMDQDGRFRSFGERTVVEHCFRRSDLSRKGNSETEAHYETGRGRVKGGAASFYNNLPLWLQCT